MSQSKKEMPKDTHKYTNEEVTVVWKPNSCIHSTLCWKGLLEVFNPREKPVAKISDDALELEIKVVPEKLEEEEEKVVENLPPYEPTLDLRDYKYPPLTLLEAHGSEKIIQDTNELQNNKNQIIETLRNYSIEIQKISATVGPTVTLYEIVPAPGVRISKIKNLEDDIALSLAALGIRIIAPIPGKGTIGIEVPNVRKTIVSMKSMLSSEKFQNNKHLFTKRFRY